MTITIKREYSILPQRDRDDFHHHVRGDKVQGSLHYTCILSLIVFVILLILAGVAALTASMFFSDSITTTFGELLFDSTEANHHMVETSNDSLQTHSVGLEKDEDKEHHNSIDNPDQNNDNSSVRLQQHSHEESGNDSSSLSNGESDIGNANSTLPANETIGNNSQSIMDGNGDVMDVNLEELKEKFADAMRDLEKNMENVMGIRRAEFVIPIFMLTCFLTFFALISLCCCCMMRRTENRRKKLFGKLITDLQSGDSKTVLLNHSDLDD